MKQIKKIVAALLCVAMVFAMCACSNTSTKTKDTYKVGICQLVQHPALDAATEGFKNALKAKLGDKVQFVEQNAAGDVATCTTIIDALVAENVDLILANATAPLQAAAAGTKEIPILGTSITDYATALDISDWTGTTGRNISGTSDLAPLADQASIIKELFPDAKNIGLLYCSAEANSLYQVKVMEKALTEMGYTCTYYSFTDSNDIQSVTEGAAAASDVIYIPTDNTAAASTGVIDQVCSKAKKPVVAGEEGICKGCGVATLSINYEDLGTKTGEMAAEILLDDKDITKMEVQYAPKVTKEYVASRCDALGIKVPEGYTAIEATE